MIHQILTLKTSWIFIKHVPKTNPVLVIDATLATLASDNPSHFRKDLLERTTKLIMTIKYRTREVAKISALSSWKNDK